MNLLTLALSSFQKVMRFNSSTKYCKFICGPFATMLRDVHALVVEEFKESSRGIPC